MRHDLIRLAAQAVPFRMENALTYDRTKIGPGRPRAPRAECPNLIGSWRTLHGELEEAALDMLNERLGSRYTLSRISEWERGVRQPNAAAANYMLCEVLPSLLQEAGLSEDEAEQIADHVALPEPRH